MLLLPSKGSFETSGNGFAFLFGLRQQGWTPFQAVRGYLLASVLLYMGVCCSGNSLGAWIARASQVGLLGSVFFIGGDTLPSCVIYVKITPPFAMVHFDLMLVITLSSACISPTQEEGSEGLDMAETLPQVCFMDHELPRRVWKERQTLKGKDSPRS